MINNYGCTPDDGKVCNAVPSPGPEPATRDGTLVGMMEQAYILTDKALEMAKYVHTRLFNDVGVDNKRADPNCVCAEIANHVEDLKMLCETLNSIMQGLGV